MLTPLGVRHILGDPVPSRGPASQGKESDIAIPIVVH
jgi:hypothetical protein